MSGDSGKSTSGPKSGKEGAGVEARRHRLEQALRDNLRRRKAQARERAAPAAAEGSGEEKPAGSPPAPDKGPRHDP